MDGMRADVDGLRALGELARRQESHIANVESYLHETCRASGAFGGVLKLFQNSYETAFGYAQEGLRASADVDLNVAETFDECAQAYTDSDRQAYDFFARIAGGAGWDVGPFRPVGSGDARVGGPSRCVATGGTAEGEDGPLFELGALDAADSAVAFAGDWVDDPMDAMHKAVGRETVEYKGKLVFKDDLDRGGREDAKPDEARGFDKHWGTADKAMDTIADPLAKGRGDLADAAVKKVIGEDGRISSPAIDSHASARVHATADTAFDAYGAGKTVLGMREDPTLGLSASWEEMDKALDENRHQRDLADNTVDDSAVRWAAR